MHLKGTISTIKSSNDRATVKGKLYNLVDAKVLLRSAFLIDVLAKAKRFRYLRISMLIKMLNSVETKKVKLPTPLGEVEETPTLHLQATQA